MRTNLRLSSVAAALLVTAWGCASDDPVQSEREISSCDVAPATLDFGLVRVGEASDMTFTIQNTGTAAIGDAVSSPCADFSVVSGGGSYALAPGESLVVTVRFAPSALGTSTCTIGTGTACGGISCAGQGADVLPATVSIPADRDNTLYEDAQGDRSNGAGEYMFVGRTNEASQDIRRALVRFPVADSIPSGAQIDSVFLELTVTRTVVNLGAKTVSIHKVLSDWGEAGSDGSTGGGGAGSGDGAPAQPGDATWLHTFFDTATWSTPGGDYSATASATVSIDGVNTYRWGNTPEMTANVQAWLDNDGGNFGWLVREKELVARTAMRLNTRENPTVDSRPRLIVHYRY